MYVRPSIPSIVCAAVAWGGAAPAQQHDWRQDWQVAPGFAIDLDARGFHLPTSIAFVPEPGPRPEDPLYFVNELRGTVKVVTNDRSVHVFATDFFELKVEEELPGMKGEAGLTGLCLEPENGYVFVSFNYQDANGILRNNIARFTCDPVKFSLRPTATEFFTEIFADHPSAISHMIGPMAVHDGALYVGVGDAENPSWSRDPDVPLGKVLRMDLDGRALPDNPLQSSDGRTSARDYVWALGLRNPFSLAFASDVLCVADNGPGIDRFVRIEPGRDYLYDGSNWSIGTRADFVFGPAVGPVQMCWVPPNSSVLPTAFAGRFYVACAGFVQREPGPGRSGERSVVGIPFDAGTGTVTDVPTPFLEYVGNERQMPCGVALGPDGLYVACLFPIADGTSAILRIREDRANPHPRTLGQSHVTLMAARGCLSCHSMEVDGSAMLGPVLERNVLVSRLLRRLHSPEYEARLDEVDAIDAEPFRSFRFARDEVRQNQGIERVRAYLRYQIQEPRFDDPRSQMPTLGLTDEQALLIANGLLAGSGDSTDAGIVDRFRLWLADLVPRPRQRHLVLFFGFGAIAGGIGVGVVLGLRRLLRRRRHSQLEGSLS